MERAFDKNDSTINRMSPDFDQLRCTKERLLTFHDWPQTTFVSPAHLAREGFFYTGTGDLVQCAYCRGCIRDWEPTDNPREEHKKHFPNCSFVLGREASRKEIIKGDSPTSALSSVQSQQSSIYSSYKTSHGSVREAAASEQFPLVSGDPPKFPMYTDYFARVASFQNGTIGQGQTKEGLADAGWFFVGPNDKVRCFQCGGNLRDWEAGDDPWKEHKRWYGHCQYTKTHRPTTRARTAEVSLPITSVMTHNYLNKSTEVRKLELELLRDEANGAIQTQVPTAVAKKKKKRKKKRIPFAIPVSAVEEFNHEARDEFERTFLGNEASLGASPEGDATTQEPNGVGQLPQIVVTTDYKRNDLDPVWANQRINSSHLNDQEDFLGCNARRRATFESWVPQLQDACANVFANKGYFSTGKGDEVKCYYCKISLSGRDLMQQPFDGTNHLPSCSAEAN